MGVHRVNLTEVDRRALEHVSKTLGVDSAASRALADADAHDGPVRFFLFRDQILVEKSRPDETTHN